MVMIASEEGWKLVHENGVCGALIAFGLHGICLICGLWRYRLPLVGGGAWIL